MKINRAIPIIKQLVNTPIVCIFYLMLMLVACQEPTTKEESEFKARFVAEPSDFGSQGGEGRIKGFYTLTTPEGKVIEEGELAARDFQVQLVAGDSRFFSLDQVTKQFRVSATDTPSTYSLSIQPLRNKALEYFLEIKCAAKEKEVVPPPAFSPFIAKVYAYCPAPGQFVNKLPVYEEGSTTEQMAEVCFQRIGGEHKKLISLGGFGGYVIFGFDHRVENRIGSDIAILGNAFANAAEPGIVCVARDDNGNGLPDDAWYELIGSAHNDPRTIRNYEITYYRPQEETTSPTYILWRDNLGKEGYIPKNEFHTQSYFPLWLKEDSYTLKGTRLPNNAIKEGEIWKLPAFEWGYVDNLPNSAPEGSLFDIANAHDNAGNRVQLDGIDFVKVYTAVNQVAGLLGESSTEITHAYDVHLFQK